MSNSNLEPEVTSETKMTARFARISPLHLFKAQYKWLSKHSPHLKMLIKNFSYMYKNVMTVSKTLNLFRTNLWMIKNCFRIFLQQFFDDSWRITLSLSKKHFFSFGKRSSSHGKWYEKNVRCIRQIEKQKSLILYIFAKGSFIIDVTHVLILSFID